MDKNTLIMKWCDEDKDIKVYYPKRFDGSYVFQRLCSSIPNIDGGFDPSFIDELKARGYDIETIEFSIKLKEPLYDKDGNNIKESE